MAWDSRIAHLLDEDVGGVAGLIRAKQAGDHPPRARHRATLRRLAPVAVVPSDRHGAALGAAARPSARLFARGPDLRWKRDDARDSECQIGHDRIVTWRKIHPSQMFFSPTVVNPLRKPPRGAHTDARNDAKLSHVQHSSTCKHGPSRDQAGTRRCVPHLAQRPGPFARHLFFFPGTPPTRGIFSTRDATRSALRDPRFRVSPPRGTSASVTYVSYPDGPSVRAVSGARRRPSPPVQHSSTRHAFPTHAALFVNIVSFFRRLWRLAGLGSARHSRRRRRTTRALASLLRQPLKRQPPQLDRRARPSQIHRPPQPRRGRRRHPRSRRSAVAMSGDFTRRTRRCDTARLLPTSARDENERRRGG